MTILLNYAVIIICLSSIYYMFLVLNGVDSPCPVLETQVLVLVFVLVLVTKVQHHCHVVTHTRFDVTKY